jgi:hypothetical protein
VPLMDLNPGPKDYEDNNSTVRQTAIGCNWLKFLQSLATDQ